MDNIDLLKQIDIKEKEINEFWESYNMAVEQEKNAVLKAKSIGMNKSKYLLSFEFESNSQRTPQYLEFHRVFKREFSVLLKPYIKRIEISKPNHFDITGFFETIKGTIYYFSIGDLRWDKKQMLIRTAKDFKDYTGGSNGFINLNNIETEIISYLKS